MPFTAATLAVTNRRPNWFYVPNGSYYTDVVITPGDGRGWGDPTKPGLMYMPGYQGSAVGIINGDYGNFLRDIVERFGAPMYVPHVSNGWGNDADYNLIVPRIAYFGTLCGTNINRLIIFGGSMGGTTMSTYASRNKSKVLALIGMETVTDLTDIVTNNRPHTAAIHSAYGGNYTEAQYGATNNPATMAANGVFDGIMYLGWASQNDNICVWQTIKKMAEDIGGGSKWYFFYGTEHSAGVREPHAKWVEEWLRPFGDPPWMRKQWAVGADTVDQFFCSGTYTAPSYPVAVRVLAVGGGGAGGGHHGTGVVGGGGGGGEVIEYTFNVHGPTQVIVGKPGLAANYMGTGGNGETSQMGPCIALGGGGGGSSFYSIDTPGGPWLQPPAGGLGTGGGGGSWDNLTKGTATGTGGDGFAGGPGTFGWGGAGGGASNGDAINCNGGDGKQSDITGAVAYYGGGGGGGVGNSHNGEGYGGLGGGGNGRGVITYERATSNNGRPGVDGLGGGGGPLGMGGWGTVIIRRGPSIPLIPPATTTVTSLVPNTGFQTSGDTVDVNGTGFIPTTKVVVDLVPVQTTYVSATKVTTTHLGALGTAKTYTVGVLNPNEEPSNTKPFTVNVTPPSTSTVTSLSPNTAPADGGVTIEVNGTAFTAGAKVVAGGLVVQTAFVSATKLTTTYFATYPNEGVVQVGAKNPNEQQTNTLPLTLTTAPPPVSTNLYGWYDASHDLSCPEAPPGSLTAWNCKWGTGRNANNRYGPQISPLRGGNLNGKKFISFRPASGTTGILYAFNFPAGLTATGPITIMGVARTVNTINHHGWMAVGTYLSHSLGSATYGVIHEYSEAGHISDGPEMINVWNVQTYTRTATTGGTAKLRKNGVEVGSLTGNLVSIGDLALGSGYHGAGYVVDCDIAEVLVYNRVLDSTELTTMETYLKNKWAVP